MKTLVELRFARDRRWPVGLDTDLEARCVPELRDVLTPIWESREWVYDELFDEAKTDHLRGRLPVVQGEIAGIPVVVKRLHRGGMAALVLKDGFVSAGRVMSFLESAEFLRDRGVLTPRVLFAAWRRRNGLIRAEMGFERIPGRDADHYFFAESGPPEGWEEECRKIGEMVARLHRVGFEHGDLNLMNVFLRDDGSVFILDLDKAVHHESQIDELTRERNLARLDRSIRKQGRSHDQDWVGAIVRLVREGYTSAMDE